LRIEVRVEIRPTESEAKVKKALMNLFDFDEIEVEEFKEIRFLVGKGKGAKCLSKLYEALRRQQILDAARQYLERGRELTGVRFYLHKQAAYAGKVSFCSFEYGESPLGAIVVYVETSDPDAFIDWLTPRTIDGKPIGERKPPDP